MGGLTITMDIKECNQNPTLSKVYTLLNVG
jgi:hypothetical protein